MSDTIPDEELLKTWIGKREICTDAANMNVRIGSGSAFPAQLQMTGCCQ